MRQTGLRLTGIQRRYVLHGALTGLGVVGGGLAFVASFRQLIFHGSEDGR